MSIGMWWARLRSSHPVWYGDEDSAVLINLNSGRVIGRWRHDGSGQWDVDLCLPYWRTGAVIWSSPARFAAFASFPFCWVSLVPSKSRACAEEAVLAFAGRVLIERDVPDEEGEPAET